MMTVMVQDAPTNACASDSIVPLIDAVGQDHFGPALASYLHSLCGADHFAAFRLGGDQLREVAACCFEPAKTARDRVDSYVQQGLWRADPAMNEAHRHVQRPTPTLIHVDFSDSGYTDLRSRLYPHVRDRVLLCGRSGSGSFGLSVLRADPHNSFGELNIRRLGDAGNVLMSLVSKHAELCERNANIATALTELRQIEACVADVGGLPRRETEVSSRILYGMSSIGIALDLEVSEETVKTYRKRAYQRLNIGSERELLTWYLALWSRWTTTPLPRIPCTWPSTPEQARVAA